MRLHSCSSFRVCILTNVHHRNGLQWVNDCQKWILYQKRKVAQIDESRFLLNKLDVTVHLHQVMVRGCITGGGGKKPMEAVSWIGRHSAEKYCLLIHIEVTLLLTAQHQ